MNYPKIRINCTSQNDLTINNKKITIINYNKYSNNLINDKNISRILILYEDNLHNNNNKNFINKTLEFYLYNEISKEEFELFIQKLHNLGYKSKKEAPKIQYFNSSNNIEFNYNFNTIKPFEKNSVNNVYHRQNLYINFSII